MIKFESCNTSESFFNALEINSSRTQLIVLKSGKIESLMKGKHHLLQDKGIIHKPQFGSFHIISAEHINADIISFDGDENDLLLAEAFLFLCPMTGIFQLSTNHEQFIKIEKILSLMEVDTNNHEIMLIHVILIVKYLNSFISPENSIRITEHHMIREFVNLMNLEFSFSHEVKYFANKMAVSTRTLNRIFKENTGMTPKQSLYYRLNAEAKKNLMNKNFSIKEIAYNLGFKSPEYFEIFFRKFNGVSPTIYSKNLAYNMSFLSHKLSS